VQTGKGGVVPSGSLLHIYSADNQQVTALFLFCGKYMGNIVFFPYFTGVSEAFQHYSFLKIL